MPASTPLSRALGVLADPKLHPQHQTALRRRVFFRLIADGLIDPAHGPDPDVAELAAQQRGRRRSLGPALRDHRCPVDRRIEAFLAGYFRGVDGAEALRVPGQTVTLDRHGFARTLSLPANGERIENEYVQSVGLHNGVVHNPRNDKRTTAGTFHVVEDGLPVPAGKKAVPRNVFVRMFAAAMNPPADLAALPFTRGLGGSDTAPAQAWTSLLLRPLVRPAVPGVVDELSMEVRFFAPGALVSNLDFVESIFGNAGDPDLAENDAGLDAFGWSGHTGCVILAPHLDQMTKKELGLPHIKDATDAQKRDGMCWEKEDEIYNEGGAFKVTCRDARGVIVTLIADNYFGYCKKEVKTQISYATNLMGNGEEEHAGGTLANAAYNLGDTFRANSRRHNGRTFEDVAQDMPERMNVMPEGYGIDRQFPQVVYVPGDAVATVGDLSIRWTRDATEHRIDLEPGKHYLAPSGYRFRMVKHPGAPSWRLVGTVGEGWLCHKPCTVSGGGKSEISKSLRDYMLYGPIYVADVEADLDLCQQIFDRDFGQRWKTPYPDPKPSRPLLDPERSLGSVIKLLTPSDQYTEDYNQWLGDLPAYLFPIVFIIKRFYDPAWDAGPESEPAWRSHFGVDAVNGFPGHELKMDGRKLVGSYLRVGLDGLGEDAAWRTFKLRQDFLPADKMSTEDDISASVVVPARQLQNLNSHFPGEAFKFIKNCEYRFFQRPDDAIHRGLDRQTELDLSQPDNFISNFEPLDQDQARAIVKNVVAFDGYSKPMRRLLKRAAAEGGHVVASDRPRIVDGKPTKNPRYLQTRPDLHQPLTPYLADLAPRLARGVPDDDPVPVPVNAVLIGRRNNPPDYEAGIRPLAVYNPIHYQELPELFMDFICSLTGKSPSTTGAGSEGALTKRPFNALRPTADLNTALVSYALTGLHGFSTSAGYVGPHYAVGHDISLLIPEVWCRLAPAEVEPDKLIAEGLLEPIPDFTGADGKPVLASRLGYRVTRKFVAHFFGRVFDNPTKVFTDAMLHPERQDQAAFEDGVRNITEAQQRVAMEYFDGGAIEEACPPLKALLHIMAHGKYEGKDENHPDIRAMFTRDAVLESGWYRKRLETRQQRDIARWTGHVQRLDDALGGGLDARDAAALGLADRRAAAKAELQKVSEPGYVETLVGTLGADPLGA